MWERLWRRTWRTVCRFGAWYVNGCSASLAILGHPDASAPRSTDVDVELHTYARHGVADLEAWLAAHSVSD